MVSLSRFRRKSSAPTESGSNPGLIGLDISIDHIHLCQIRSLEHGQYSIIAKESVAFSGSRDALLASPKKLKKLIGTALKNNNFKGRKVVALMPWDEVKIILLTYKANVTDVDREVLKMLSNRLDGDIDDHVIDYIPVRSNPSNDEHMVVATAAPKDKVSTLLNALVDCGLEVDSLDIAPTALRRIVSTLYSGEAADNVLLINTYYDESYLTIVSGRRLLLNQAVNFGENTMLDRIAVELDISRESARELVRNHGLEKRRASAGGSGEVPANDISATLQEILKPCFLELKEEINRVLIFTASETHGVPVSRVCLFGNIAAWPGARELLLSLLEFDVPDGRIEFLQIFRDENDNTRIPWGALFSDLSIAMGLALRGLVPNE